MPKNEGGAIRATFVFSMADAIPLPGPFGMRANPVVVYFEKLAGRKKIANSCDWHPACGSKAARGRQRTIQLPSPGSVAEDLRPPARRRGALRPLLKVFLAGRMERERRLGCEIRRNHEGSRPDRPYAGQARGAGSLSAVGPMPPAGASTEAA